MAFQDGSGLPGAKHPTVSATSKDETSMLVQAIKAALTATNKNETVCPMNASTVQKFMILPADFSVSTDDFTPTFKLKRQAVHERYAEAIDAMYKSKEVYVKFPGL